MQYRMFRCRHANAIRSFWTLTGSPSLLQHSATAALARETRLTTEQVVYALAMSQGIIPLAGSTNDERMKHGVDVGSYDLASLAERSEFAVLQKLVQAYS
jgi:hypothetical protein